MRRRTEQPAFHKLSPRQQFLLTQIPQSYDVKKFEEPDEPREIKTARVLVTKYDEKMRIETCKHSTRMQALCDKAREAVYFEPEEKSLEIVRQVRKMTLKTCTPDE